MITELELNKSVVIDSDFIRRHIQQEIGKKLFSQVIAKSDFAAIILPWLLEAKMPDTAWNRLNNVVSTPRSLSGRLKTSLSSSSSSSKNKEAKEVLFSDQVKASIKTALSVRELSREVETEIENACGEQALRQLAFPSLQLPYVSGLSKFIKSLSPVEKEQPIVKCFIQWLTNKFNPERNADIKKLNNFFIIYEVYNKITQHSFVMDGDESGELVKKLKLKIESYFNNGFKVPEALSKKIQPFLAVHDSLSEAKKISWVENFLKNWFANNVDTNNDDDDDAEASSQTRAELFCELCNSDYQACIRVSDQTFKEGYQQYSTASSGKVTTAEVGAYFTNLCLLYALTVPVNEWSVAFHDTLNKVSQKPNVYPALVLQQVKYMLECYLVPSTDTEKRPELAILTPTLIKTPDDVHLAFSYIANAVNRGQCPAQFIRDAVAAMKTKIKNINANNLIEWLSQFKNDRYRQLVLQELLDNLEDLDFVKTKDLISLFQGDSTRLKILKAVEKKLPSLLYEDVVKLFALFEDDTQHPRVLKLIKHKLPNVAEETLKLISLAKGDARRLRVLKILRDNLTNLTCEVAIKFISLFESEEHRLKVLKTIKAKLPIFNDKEIALILAQFKIDAKRQEIYDIINNTSNPNKVNEVKFGDNLVEFCSWVKVLSEKAEIEGIKFLQELCVECKTNLTSAKTNAAFFKPGDNENYIATMEKLHALIENSKSISIQNAVDYLARLLEGHGKKISDIGRMLKTASKAVLTRHSVNVEEAAALTAVESEDATSASLSAIDENEDDDSASSSLSMSNSG